MLGDVNKLFVFKSLLTKPSNVMPLHLKQTFPPIIWIFTKGEGDWMESRLPFRIFFTLQFSSESWISDVSSVYERPDCSFFFLFRILFCSFLVFFSQSNLICRKIRKLKLQTGNSLLDPLNACMIKSNFSAKMSNLKIHTRIKH